MKRGLAAERVSRLSVIDAFAPARSKFDVALRLADIFPTLAKRLPRKRRAWTTEDARMNIFDALWFAAAAIRLVEGRKSSTSWPTNGASRLA